MHVSRSELTQLADALFQARVNRVACAPLTESFPALTLQDAYTMSDINLKRRCGQGGVRLVGKKIGLTSVAVQKQLGVNEPDFGYLTSDMAVALGGTVSIASLLQARVEGETAFVLKSDLAGPGVTAAQVIQATDFVLPCIEIIDSRVRDWKIKIQDTVADNASSALFVLGTEPSSLRSVELARAGMSLRINGEVLSTGTGAACLSHPVNAVAWLANTLGRFGETLRAGEVILSGAFGPVVPVKAGDRVDVSIAGLGDLHCFFGA